MYLISTKFGMIPNVCNDGIPSLSKDRIFFIDDFIYKDSLFYSNNISLRKFCCVPENIKIYLMFKNDKIKKNGSRTITSKRGYMVISKEEYEKFIKILDPDYFQDFSSKDTVLDRMGEKTVIYNVKDLESFNELEIKNIKFINTLFINELIESGKMLKISTNKLVISDDIFDCKCCGYLTEGYFKHLKEMKEINFLYYLTIHNYNTLDKLIKDTRIIN